jgi:putative thiamine transport system permease protein
MTTETVSIASGSDRRIIAVYALGQFILPLCFYLAAILLPATMFKNRTKMQS